MNVSFGNAMPETNAAVRPIPRPALAGLLSLQVLSVALIVAGFPGVVIAGALGLFGLAVAFASFDVRLMLLACIPLTQPLVLGRGGEGLAIYPEYLIIPVAFLLLMVDRIRHGMLALHRSRLVVPLVLFLPAAAASLLIAVSDKGLSAASTGIASLVIHILAVLYFIIALEWFGGRYPVRSIFAWMFAASVLVSLLGIAEYFVISGEPGRSFRAGSTMGVVFADENRGNPNVLAAYVVMMSVMALSMLSVVSTKARAAIAGGLLLHVVTLLLTGSRSGVVALLAGMVWLAMRGRRRLLWWMIPAAAIGVAIAANVPSIVQRYTSIVSIVTSGDLIRFFLQVDPRTLDWAYIGYFGLGGFDIDTLAGANRFAAWVLGLRTFLEHPVFGVGLQMNLHYTGYSTSENYFLDVLVMTGFVGSAFVAVWLMRVARLLRSVLRLDLEPDERAFAQGFSAAGLSMIIVSLTGSVFLSLKLMLVFLTWTAMLWHIGRRGERWHA